MANHGVYVREESTNVGTPIIAESAIPYIVGAAPVWMAEDPAPVNVPIACYSWADAVKHFGYSGSNWSTYGLCESMYALFRLYNTGPIIMCNVLDISNPTAVELAEKTVTKHQITMPITTMNDATLVVKTAASGEDAVTLVKGTDYTAYYDNSNLIIELLSGSDHYAKTTLYVSCTQVDTSGVNATAIYGGIEAVELCVTTLGIVPDMILAPGWSHQRNIASAMAAKAASINGLFPAKALIDLNVGSGGALTYSAAITAKSEAAMTDKGMVVLWPMLKNGDIKYHFSLHLAGVLATLDTENDGVPYESPSNKAVKANALVLDDGTPVNLTKAQADALNNNGIVTALNFMGGWKIWGNYTACYPDSADVKDYYIPISRMFDWVARSVVQSFWTFLDMPMNRRLVDTIIDTANIWLNSLVGSGYLLGARIELDGAENSLEKLMAGIVKVHIYMTPPSPAQEIDFTLEYDANYVADAFSE